MLLHAVDEMHAVRSTPSNPTPSVNRRACSCAATVLTLHREMEIRWKNDRLAVCDTILWFFGGVNPNTAILHTFALNLC